MNKRTCKIALLAGCAALFMFGFSFALSPLYRLVCKQTGLNGGVNVAEVKDTYTGAPTANNPEILVQFVTTNNANLPWDFYPQQTSLKTHTEALMKAIFIVKNNTDHTMTVQAIPSFAPPIAAKYFHKIECFCFTQQTLAAGETKEMPVVFRIDKTLPADVHTITLAYTLFDATGKRTSR